jgi:ATP-binding cassette subfamily C protein
MTLARATSDNALPRRDQVVSAVVACRGPLTGVAIFSAFINILGLTGSLYMLQITDRILSSRSISTLVSISLLALVAYLLLGALDALRCRMLARIGAKFSESLVTPVFRAGVSLCLQGKRPAIAFQGISDLDQIQRFFSGAGLTALFDMPFLPIFFLVAYMMHPIFGGIIVLGGLITVVLSVIAELRTRQPTTASTVSAAARHAIADASFRNAETLKAMALTPAFARSFSDAHARYASHNIDATNASSGIGSTAKVFRAILQSSVLGIGAYLAIIGEVTPGATIAASILTARALAPVELAVANWRGLTAARQSLERLRNLSSHFPESEQRIELAPPRTELSVEHLYAVAPGQTKPIIKGVSFALMAGQGLGIIGPSASGKSSLARALIGVWPAARGRVSLDGASIDHWDHERLGRHIGYLPQTVELFDGTIAANIARFCPDASSDGIIQAARDAAAHEMILRLPEGYETRVSDNGATLSAGQRQRIGLARALYGRPFLVVLDEPNSNLDADGEDALLQAILGIRERCGIVVVVTHRPTALAGVDLVGVMIEGRLQAFGPKREVMQRMTKQHDRPLQPIQHFDRQGAGYQKGTSDDPSRIQTRA